MTKAGTLSIVDRIDLNMYKYLYTASIAKEVAQSGEAGGNSFGILIIGMIVVIVGIVGFIISKNSK